MSRIVAILLVALGFTLLIAPSAFVGLFLSITPPNWTLRVEDTRTNRYRSEEELGYYVDPSCLDSKYVEAGMGRSIPLGSGEVIIHVTGTVKGSMPFTVLEYPPWAVAVINMDVDRTVSGRWEVWHGNTPVYIGFESTYVDYVGCTMFLKLPPFARRYTLTLRFVSGGDTVWSAPLTVVYDTDTPLDVEGVAKLEDIIVDQSGRHIRAMVHSLRYPDPVCVTVAARRGQTILGVLTWAFGYPNAAGETVGLDFWCNPPVADGDIVSLYTWGILLDEKAVGSSTTRLPVATCRFRVEYTEGGEVSTGWMDAMVPAGTVIEIRAYPWEGWVFRHWLVDGSTVLTGNPLRIVVDKDTSVKPVFEKVSEATTPESVEMENGIESPLPEDAESEALSGRLVFTSRVESGGWMRDMLYRAIGAVLLAIGIILLRRE